MWGSFLLCAAVILLALYVPGYFFFRAFKVSRIFSVGCAPVYSVAMYALLPIIYHPLGIFCNWLTLLFPALFVALALFTAFNRRGLQHYGQLNVNGSWLIMLLYLLCGVLACCFIVVAGLGDFDTYYCRYDNATHLNLIRSFVDSGIWSSTDSSTYLTSPSNAQPYDAGGSFYPSAWHDIAAFAVSLTNCPVAVAANALNCVVSGIIFPVGMLPFMLLLCKNDHIAIIVGAVVTPAFNSFPWYFFLKGPLVANMLSFALVPASCALFIALCKGATKKLRYVVAFCILAISVCAALGLSQTNALFTFYIFASAYCAHQLRLYLSNSEATKAFSCKKKITLFALFVIAAVGIWLIAYKMPLFREVIRFRSLSDNGLDPVNSLYDVLSLGLVPSCPLWLLAAFAVVGILALIARKRLWMLFPPSYFAIAYFAARTFYERRPRQILAGFWYSDPTRIAGCLTIFLTPIICIGIATVLRLVLRWMRHVAHAPLSHRTESAIVGILLVVFCLYAYFPNYTPDIWAENEIEVTPIGKMKQRIADVYGAEVDKVYSKEERDFVQKAKSLIPDGALVINHPQDGSVFSYGLDGLNTYFRYPGSKGYSATADTIRGKMNEIASDDSVLKAVESTGADYLLLLDQGVPYNEGTWLPQYYEMYVPLWDGLNKITDDTPGLELILADGDMRLYKITGTDDGGASGE